MHPDVALFRLINNLTMVLPAPLSAFFRFMAVGAPFIFGAVFILLWFFAARQAAVRRAVVLAVLSGVLALALNFVISHLWNRLRPFAVLHHVHQLVAHAPYHSFPSDHAAGSFAFATVMFLAGRFWGWAFLVTAVVVAFARVYVGVHWPSDVAGGAVVGFLAAKVVLAERRELEPLVRRVVRILPRR